MNLATFFSKQARRPEGWFGRFVMRIVFDRGNAFLNNLVEELMSVQGDDHIIEIGSGTGKLIHKMARNIDQGFVQGVDFSGTMVSIARKRNRNALAQAKVIISEGDFDAMPLDKATYTKACSVNTLYFWPSPMQTARKIADILKPGGKLVLAFEDIDQLRQRNLNRDIFHLHSEEDIRDLLIGAGFRGSVEIVTRQKGDLTFHCVVARK